MYDYTQHGKLSMAILEFKLKNIRQGTKGDCNTCYLCVIEINDMSDCGMGNKKKYL